ncbi:putative B3 domain-containing protein At2g27410 [Morus notabilis]|uniref:putative B3 domain-containing protein At2g27410 n=1 Tax=Morus notabilis TaxID=981085 RepID=UPI000CED2E7A|nr:putative B3 domain-containing protein At2g27410 [Morus notabilis]
MTCPNQNVEYLSESDDHEQPLSGTRKWVRQVVQETGEHGERLLLWKRLSESDLENRISMPVIYLLYESDEFLKEEDIKALLRWKNHHDDLKGFQDVDVMLFEPCLNKSILRIRKWHYGTSLSLYEFTIVKKKWHEIAERNGFKKDDILQIWFFRSRNGNPCFALANLTSAEDNLPTTSDAASTTETS